MPITRPSVTKLSERDIRDGNSFREDFTPDGVRTTRSFFTKWDERYDLVIGVCGYSQIARVSGGGPVRLERLLPLQHPQTSGSHARAVVGIRGHQFTGRVADPVAAGGGWGANYKWAACEVEYRPDEFDYLTDDQTPADEEWRRYFSYVEATQASEYLTFPTGSMRYAPEDGDARVRGLMVPYSGGMVIPTMSWKFRWWELPLDLLTYGEPWFNRITGTDTDRSYIGCVNSAPWPNPANGFPAGTLLLDSVIPVRRKNALGNVCLDVDINVLFKESGWNNLWYNSTEAGVPSGWRFVTRDPGATYYAPGSVPDDTALYSERPFADLLKVQA
jgi:hypothetical protein